MKEDDDEEEEMEGQRKDEEDIQDSLVVQEGMIVKFVLVPVITFAVPASRFFPARRSLKPHCTDTQRSKTMNYLATHQATDHLPLATLPCLPEQCNHYGNNFSRKSSLSKYMLVVHGVSRPSKILQDLP